MAGFCLKSPLAFRITKIEVKEGDIRIAADSAREAAVDLRDFAERYYEDLIDQRKSLVDMAVALQAERMVWQHRLNGLYVLYNLFLQALP